MDGARPYRPTAAQEARDLASDPRVHALGMYLHAKNPDRPIDSMLASIRSQGGGGQYRSEQAEGMLDARHGGVRPASDLARYYAGATPNAALGNWPRAQSGTGKAYVPDSADSQYLKDVGYATIANHELEHAYGQSPEMPIDGRFREIPATVGDLVFRAEQHQMEQGKPLQHTVKFPSGKRHSAQWMQEQALQHGYWDGPGQGKTMSQLLFDTPEGRAWVRQAAGAYSK